MQTPTTRQRRHREHMGLHLLAIGICLTGAVVGANAQLLPLSQVLLLVGIICTLAIGVRATKDGISPGRLCVLSGVGILAFIVAYALIYRSTGYISTVALDLQAPVPADAAQGTPGIPATQGPDEGGAPGYIETPNYLSCLYFSAVTWTTLGYGDLQPHPKARIYAGLEAVSGYVYMTLTLGLVLGSLMGQFSGRLGTEDFLQAVREVEARGQQLYIKNSGGRITPFLSLAEFEHPTTQDELPDG